MHYINKEWLEKVLPLLIITIAIYTLCTPNAMGCTQYVPLKKAASRLKQWLLGFTLGFYDGFAGPGTGAFGPSPVPTIIINHYSIVVV